MTTDNWGQILLDLLLNLAVLAVVFYDLWYARISGWWVLFAILLGSWAAVGLVGQIRRMFRPSSRAM